MKFEYFINNYTFVDSIMAKSEEDQNIDIPQNIGMNNSNVLSLYMDQTINNALVREVRNMTKQFNVKSLISIIFLMGIDNLKIYVNNILTLMPEYVKTSILYLYNKFISNKCTKKLDINDIKQLISNNDFVDDFYSMNINHSFEELLLDYIVQNNGNNVHYNEFIYEYCIVSKNKFKYNLRIENVIINYKDNNISLIDIFDINYTKINNEIKNVTCNDNGIDSSQLLFLNKLTSVLGLPLYRQNDICKSIYNYIIDNTKKYGDLNDEKYNSSHYLKTIVADQISLTEVKKMIIIDNKLFNGLHKYVIKDSGCANNYIILTLITIAGLYVQFYLENKIVFNNTDLLFGYKNKNIRTIDYSNINSTFHNFFKDLFTPKECKTIYNKLSTYVYDKNEKYFKESYGENFKGDLKLNMNITNNGRILDKVESTKIAEDFVYYLYSMNHKDSDNNDIDVYNINITRKEVILNEYEPSKLLEKKLEDGTIEKIMIPEKPQEVSIKVKAVMEKINTIYKDFSTLYLKEKDEFKLKNILDTFDKKKELYKKIGIPFKFSCLLYGSPGTGKTSAIKSISSYLKRDIYYLDISKITTNEELTKVFKDINENTKDNGVIVMEDIDAMSDIVLEREDKSEKNDNGELTLSHLLNILDGTLTRDDMIFIATTNYIDKIDKALKRPGRFDITINLTECDRYQYSVIYKSILQRDLSSDLLDKLETYKITPAKFIYSLIQYIGYTDEEISDEKIIDALIESLD